ncbi:hypothetical protein PLICRDRAFT_640590 [Plicaturopsis crispa FD-325 SS-3]|nr:hypothetical protein PLICRDRAFT_640590 [Plicaturopsis crispa FD-325 SS-3]
MRNRVGHAKNLEESRVSAYRDGSYYWYPPADASRHDSQRSLGLCACDYRSSLGDTENPDRPFPIRSRHKLDISWISLIIPAAAVSSVAPYCQGIQSPAYLFEQVHTISPARQTSTARRDPAFYPPTTFESFSCYPTGRLHIISY